MVSTDSGRDEISLVPADIQPPLFTSLWAGPGLPAPVLLPIPDDDMLVGQSVYLQGVTVDVSAGAGVPFGLTEALELRIGAM